MNLRNMASVYIFNGNKVLLMKKNRSKIFSKPDTVLWCPIGGHFENEELNNPDKCVIRELFEETSFKESDIKNLELKYITIRIKDMEIRQQYIYFADLANINAALSECDEGEMYWIKTDDIFKLEMSFTNTQCLSHYFQNIQNGKKDKFIYVGVSGISGDNMPKVVFTPLRDFYTAY